MGLACPAPFGAGPHGDWQAVNTVMPETSQLQAVVAEIIKASESRCCCIVLLEREKD